MGKDGRNRLETSSREPKPQRHHSPKTLLCPHQALTAPGPSRTGLGAGICSWGCRADLHAVKLAPYLLLLAKGEIVQVHAAPVCETAFTNPACTFPVYTDFYNSSDQSHQIPTYNNSPGDSSFCTDTRLSTATVMKECCRKPSLCQAPLLTAKAGRAALPSPSKQHSPPGTRFYKLPAHSAASPRASPTTPSREGSRQLSPQQSVGQAVPRARGPLSSGAASPRAAAPHPAPVRPLIPF